MNRLAKIAIVSALLAVPTAASAQTVCPEGRTREGTCVNPALAIAARTIANVRGQSRLSYFILPVLPSQDQSSRDPTLRNLRAFYEIDVVHP
ncbi:hypothetical protein E8L99_23460 [Phreatobacter aquaticus]|uniref:Uncharacterized protein n=1 Tax=Phreatobacter aquaticus TaxID=2570229 RepID=A0A4D7QML7_9HYPH|nr:hypothetical protein [Phreatobacter aquaticus]QCK88505.1 hypothetical protein E8L99_23460 [Phreatobacter aquaticus]